MKKRKKYYVIVPEKGKYFFGAFLRNREGKIAAQKYLKHLQLTNKTKFFIK